MISCLCAQFSIRFFMPDRGMLCIYYIFRDVRVAGSSVTVLRVLTGYRRASGYSRGLFVFTCQSLIASENVGKVRIARYVFVTGGGKLAHFFLSGGVMIFTHEPFN